MFYERMERAFKNMRQGWRFRVRPSVGGFVATAAAVMATATTTTRLDFRFTVCFGSFPHANCVWLDWHLVYQSSLWRLRWVGEPPLSCFDWIQSSRLEFVCLLPDG